MNNKDKNKNILVMVRHGQSQWNLDNKFTGFFDAPLTEKGIEEAKEAGRILAAAGFKFDHVYTSTLSRAILTTTYILEQGGDAYAHLKNGDNWNMIQHPDLRERDYGDLVGLNKAETAEKFGKEQVHIWRRSYDIPPPGGESLKMVVEDRVGPYFNKEIMPLLQNGENVLLGAHGNTLRALLIVLGQRTPDNINEAEIPTGAPIVFEFEGGEVTDMYYLEDRLSKEEG
jgi:2,3-bisphosphoglycerate-dependent phosphoglycerate mutase